MERRATPGQQRGLTLIEVLVALALLAVALLGLLALQVEVVQEQQRTRQLTLALHLAADLEARLHGNPHAPLTLDGPATGDEGGPSCRPGPCSPSAQSAHDRAEWLALVAAALPEADVRLTPTASGHEFRLRWRGRSAVGTEPEEDCPPATCLQQVWAR